LPLAPADCSGSAALELHLVVAGLRPAPMLLLAVVPARPCCVHGGKRVWAHLLSDEARGSCYFGLHLTLLTCLTVFSGASCVKHFPFYLFGSLAWRVVKQLRSSSMSYTKRLLYFCILQHFFRYLVCTLENHHSSLSLTNEKSRLDDVTPSVLKNM
jgi:hypothetical protein